MNSKKQNIVWSISLLVIGISTIILAGSNLIGIELNDMAVRILGAADIIALPILAFTSVKKIKNRE